MNQDYEQAGHASKLNAIEARARWAEEIARPALERSLACTLPAIAIATGFPETQLTARDVLIFMQEGARLAKDAYPHRQKEPSDDQR